MSPSSLLIQRELESDDHVLALNKPRRLPKETCHAPRLDREAQEQEARGANNHGHLPRSPSVVRGARIEQHARGQVDELVTRL